MKKTKVFAMYLPQYHCIPENDEFWGKGFTDWVTVKKAKPLFAGHYQPRIPMNDNYYDLSREENVEWQAKLASEHGLTGFGVYHYWFNNDKNILTKPAEILRDSKNGYVKYFLSWDNANWKRSWSNVKGNDWAPIADDPQKKHTGPQILIPYILGQEDDWRNHYNYVRTHFLSPNYEKKDNKPLFSIIVFSKEILDMCRKWEEWAKEDGFDGIYYIFQNTPSWFQPDNYFQYNYEPHYVGWFHPSLSAKFKTYPRRIINKLCSILSLNVKKGVVYLDYDSVWRRLISYVSHNDKGNVIQGSFVNYDDSPRRGKNGSKVLLGATPDKFKSYFNDFYNLMCSHNKSYIFLTAWNEWGEGAYLEPDTQFGMGYLEALKDILK